jgi:hypothetical protein
MPLVSISNDQRWPIAEVNFVGIFHLSKRRILAMQRP